MKLIFKFKNIKKAALFILSLYFVKKKTINTYIFTSTEPNLIILIFNILVFF